MQNLAGNKKSSGLLAYLKKNLSQKLADVNRFLEKSQYAKAATRLKWAIRLSNKSPSIYYQFALSCYSINKYAQAESAILNALKLNPNASAYQLLYGQILTALNKFDAALQIIKPLLDREPTKDVFLALEELYSKHDRVNELYVIANDVVKQHPQSGINLRPHSPYPINERATDLPSILLITMPKSGSIYISNRLSRALHMPIVALSNTGQGNKVLKSWAESFAAGGVLAQEHTHAHPECLTLLKSAGIDKLVIHLRDPRSTAISMLHHLDKVHAQGGLLRFVAEKRLGALHFKSPMPIKIQNAIQTLLPTHLKWLEGWLQEIELNTFGLKILLTNYHELYQDELALFKKILNFYNIPATRANFANFDLHSKAHHRKGQLEEWRTLFTKEQQIAAWEKIQKYASRFNWLP